MSERDQVLRRRPGTAGVVDLDRAVLRQGGRVDQHDRHAGAPDLLDLRDGRRDRPIATTPSTVARLIARARLPCSGEMKCSAVAELLGGHRDALR